MPPARTVTQIGWDAAVRPVLRSRQDLLQAGLVLLTPNLCEEAQPVFAHYLANLGFRPAGAFHCGGQIGEFTECAYPCRVHYLAKRTGDAPSVSLVVAYIFEEGVVLVLREVGADPDIVLAGRCGSHSRWRRC